VKHVALLGDIRNAFSRKDGSRKKGRKEGRREGRKEGRKEERKEGRKEGNILENVGVDGKL
jgi:predicted transposase YdaD